MEVGKPRGYVLFTPFDLGLGDIKTVITSRFVQISRQWNGHAADAAADLQYPFIGLQPSDRSEIAPELPADLVKIAVSHRHQRSRRLQRAFFLNTTQAALGEIINFS